MIEEYVLHEDKLLNIVTALRAVYDPWLKQASYCTDKLTKVSVDGTLITTLQEVQACT